jgi:arylsulfatase A-like enzyme/Flp pilus assembly protein TadD
MKGLVLAASVLAAFAVAAPGCSPRRAGNQSLPAGALRGANVLLVTIDTLRADRVGVYGSSRRLTPAFDQFGREGLRFDTAHAHVPLTLPSHASLLTGRYPTRHGVRDNGAFRLDDKSPTLADALKAAGYRTAAFVGSFVLDARFGLNRGFDLYDDRMLGGSGSLEPVQRNAEQVLAPAVEWILRNQPGPFFVWVHLYDPHEPYTPPEPYRTQYAGEPYDGEVAFTDAALGAFLNRLRSAGRLDRTVVVLTADHGESLGEHGERTHGLFAYEPTLRVPLVFWAPSAIRPGVFHNPARLVDVAPTVLDLVGAPPLENIDGRSVRSIAAGERPFEDPGSYFEALNANLSRNWAPLTGLVHGRHKLIDLPLPEVYDLEVDAGEQRNLYASQRELARGLESRLDQIAAGATTATPSALDAETQNRLRSLGYVVSSVERKRSYGAADDPKRLVYLDAALDEAVAMWSRGEAARAIETLQGVIRERPDLTVAYDRLAFMLRGAGRVADAVALLDDAARAGHADRSLMRSLGAMLRDAGDLKRSAAVLEPLVRDDASDLQAADALGQTYARMGRGAHAREMFERVLAASPNTAATWNNLGALLLSENHAAEAADAFSKAVSINPELATAYNGLGVAYARMGQNERAMEQWRKALALRPDYADARENLARTLR